MNHEQKRDQKWFLHQRVIKKRKELWKKLNAPDFEAKWFITRIKPHMWAIDEIYRHMLASEIFYIHSKFGTRKVPEEWGVGAQWVGNRKFGLKQDPHMPREDLLELSIQIEQKTQLFLEQMTEKDLTTVVTAPWGEEMTFKELIHHCFEHEHNHQGQIQLLITYFYQQ